MKRLLLAAMLAGTCLSAVGQYTIYPIPQKVTAQGGTIQLTPTINIVCESEIGQVTRDRVEEVLGNAGLSFKYADAPSDAQTNLYVGIAGSGETADQYAAANNLELTVFEQAANRFDPYVLQINGNTPNGDIVVLGNDDGSEYYAFATLEQILEQAGGKVLQQVTYEDYAHCEYRGIVEGFYGYPFTVENRMNLFEFCKRFKMNVFIYGPKSDPYHAGNWRLEYPDTVTEDQREHGWITKDDLRVMAAKARACHVSFVWAIHPGIENGINFTSDATMDVGIEEVVNKFRSMYELGVRGFGVFIDDMATAPAGARQAYLADQTQKKIRECFATTDKDNRIAPLFFVPTNYTLNEYGSRNLYDLKSVDSEVQIGFTGYNVFSNLRYTSCYDMANRVGRNPFFWWNNPVADGTDSNRMYMREFTTHWTIESSGPIAFLGSIVSNPMNKAQASKVALFGIADYCWNPAAFDVRKNWEDSFARIVEHGDTQTAEALKCFARYADYKVEDADVIDLYDGFRSKYDGSNFPDEGHSIRAEMTQLLAACTHIENMAGSTVDYYRYFSDDLRCWNLKLKAYASFILDALDLMENGDAYTRVEIWNLFTRLRNTYTSLGSDDFMVDVLQGQGTQVEEKRYEAIPGNAYTRPFVDFLANAIGTKLPGDWPAADQPQVITGLETAAGLTISEEGNNLILNGLSGISLEQGDYVGISLGSYEAIDWPLATFPAGIAPQISVSGKQWTTVELPLSAEPAAYVRLINTGAGAQTLGTDQLGITLLNTAIDIAPTPSTNMPQYQSNAISYVTDGSASTYFWSSRGVQAGDYVLLTYPEEHPVYEITFAYHPEKDWLTGTAAIELSADNETWHEVAAFHAGNLDANHAFTCNANGYPARYARYVVRTVEADSWLRVAEFACEMSEEKVARTTDHQGRNVEAIGDKFMSTSYRAAEAGFVEHKFIENMDIQSVEIYHNTTFNSAYDLPSVSVFDGAEWHNAGTLDRLATIIDVRGFGTITALRISWNEQNIPRIYEIIPTETVQKPDIPLAVVGAMADATRLSLRDGVLSVQSDRGLRRLVVYDLYGRIVWQADVCGNRVEATLGNRLPAVLLVRVTDEHGRVATHKVMSR